MKHLLILLISASFIGCSIFDPSFYTEKGGGEYIPKGNPGSCYAKCLMPSQKKQNNISFFEYTGDTPGVEGVVEKEIVIQTASTKWVKKKADRNCYSSDPEDCLVWCLQEVPERKELYWEVIDTSLIKEYEFVEKSYYSVTKSGLTEWKEVICEKDIDQEFLSNLALSLRAKGYSVNEPIIVTKRAVLKELTEYQKLNDLPIGSFNFESLETLDIYVDVSKNK